MDRIIIESECRQITGLSPVTRWRLEKSGEFPLRRKISANRVGWLESELCDWIESRVVSDIPRPGANSADTAA